MTNIWHNLQCKTHTDTVSAPLMWCLSPHSSVTGCVSGMGEGESKGNGKERTGGREGKRGGRLPAWPPPKTSAACLFPSRTAPSSCPPPDHERPLPPSGLLSELSAPSPASSAAPPAPPWLGEPPASLASVASCPVENEQLVTGRIRQI